MEIKNCIVKTLTHTDGQIEHWIVSNRVLNSEEISDLLEILMESDAYYGGQIEIYCSNDTWLKATIETFGNVDLNTFLDTVSKIERKYRKEGK